MLMNQMQRGRGQESQAQHYGPRPGLQKDPICPCPSTSSEHLLCAPVRQLKVASLILQQCEQRDSCGVQGAAGCGL